MKEELKQMYVALGRAVESGNPLNIGIAVGQLLPKLDYLINNYDNLIGTSTPAGYYQVATKTGGRKTSNDN